MTLSGFQAFLRSLNMPAMDRLATLMGKYPDDVEPYLPQLEIVKLKIQSRMQRGALDARRPALRRPGAGGAESYAGPREGYEADRELTMREGWTQLAALVDTALADKPAEYREAVKAVALEEAAKAA